MDKKRQDQFIIVYVHSLNDISIPMKYAVFFSRMLKKGIILLHISDPRYTATTPEQAETQLQKLKTFFPNDLLVSYAAIKGKTKQILSALPDLFGAILIISETQSDTKKSSSYPKQLLKNLYSSRIAYLTVQRPMTSDKDPFSKILLTLDSLRESKEKVLWASYFGRFHHAKTLLITEKANDTYLKQQVEYNVAFTLKIYRNFRIAIDRLPNQEHGTIDLHAAAVAKKYDAGMIICQTTKNRNFLHHIFVPPEEKVIVNMERIPILFLNPRTDLYVLCE